MRRMLSESGRRLASSRDGGRETLEARRGGRGHERGGGGGLREGEREREGAAGKARRKGTRARSQPQHLQHLQHLRHPSLAPWALALVFAPAGLPRRRSPLACLRLPPHLPPRLPPHLPPPPASTPPRSSKGFCGPTAARAAARAPRCRRSPRAALVLPRSTHGCWNREARWGSKAARLRCWRGLRCGRVEPGGRSTSPALAVERRGRIV